LVKKGRIPLWTLGFQFLNPRGSLWKEPPLGRIIGLKLEGLPPTTPKGREVPTGKLIKN